MEKDLTEEAVAPVIIIKPGLLRIVLDGLVVEIDIKTQTVTSYTKERMVAPGRIARVKKP